ncbi:MAG: sugar phosphate nucleotidyltransferase [bacterium]|nr:sugar phosphate nucleotidyltransferase [bacterium]
MVHPKEKPYIVIMAGGGGTRLWPKSRQEVPKQFLNLFSKKTLLQETYSRIAPITDNNRIFIIAPAKYAEEILRELPDLTEDNLIIESSPKGTAAAIGMASMIISKIDSDAVVHFLPADHYIIEVDEFLRVLLSATIAAEHSDNFVLWGIHPTFPAIGYEYIQSGDEVEEINSLPVFKVKGFKERPNISVAQGYVASGTHFWNGGYFTQKASVVLHGVEKTMPELWTAMQSVGKVYSENKENYKVALHGVYETLDVQNVSFDIGVMVKIKNIVVMPVTFTWTDVGSWNALYDISEKNDGTNSVLRAQGDFIGYDTNGCLVHTNGKLIAAIGLENMIIIDTNDVLMVCPRDRAQDVKKITEILKEREKKEFL